MILCKQNIGRTVFVGSDNRFEPMKVLNGEFTQFNSIQITNQENKSGRRTVTKQRPRMLYPLQSPVKLSLSCNPHYHLIVPYNSAMAEEVGRAKFNLAAPTYATVAYAGA